MKNKKKIDRSVLLEKREERRRKAAKPIVKLADTSLKPKKKAPSIMERIALLWAHVIAIDLGTANVLIYVRGKGIVLNEPSYVAKHKKTNEIIAVGEAAKKMLGRTPTDIEVIRPLRQGVIDDYDMTEYMLRYFIKQALKGTNWIRPRVMISVPSGITAVEKRAVLEASLQAGARKTVLVEEPLAAALGTGIDEAKAPGAMVVDVGGGTTDIAVLSNTGVVVSESLRIGSDDFDEALIFYMKKKKKVIIGNRSAEELKIAIGTADRKAVPKEAQVRGRDLVTGLPKAVTVTSKEVQKALEDPIQLIVERVKAVLEKTPPELVAEIVDHGILITGGGALLEGFDRLLTRSIGVPVYLSDTPMYSVVMGAGRALKEMEKFQDTLVELE